MNSLEFDIEVVNALRVSNVSDLIICEAYHLQMPALIDLDKNAVDV